MFLSIGITITLPCRFAKIHTVRAARAIEAHHWYAEYYGKQIKYMCKSLNRRTNSLFITGIYNSWNGFGIFPRQRLLRNVNVVNKKSQESLDTA